MSLLTVIPPGVCRETRRDVAAPWAEWKAAVAEAMNTTGSDPTDAELFSRIREGDADAFAEFYDRHCGLLFGVALRILANHAEADEVFQDACVSLWERAPLQAAEGGQSLAWAVTVVRNRAIDRLRSNRRKAELIESAAAEADVQRESGGDAVSGSISAETAGSVRVALETLTFDQRQAVELAFFDGLTQQEIAARLGQPLGTVKARIRRGMLALRDRLEGQL